MSIADKILLKKRALIETVNDELKNIAQIEHSGHQSFGNFIANSLSAIAAYCFFEKSLPLKRTLSRTDNSLFFDFISNSRNLCLFLKTEYRYKKNLQPNPVSIYTKLWAVSLYTSSSVFNFSANSWEMLLFRLRHDSAAKAMP